MTVITAEYVKEELRKIAFLLESNYQELLEKNHKSKIRNMIDDLPVDWNIDYSIVNDRKVKNKDDLDADDYTQDRDFRDKLKNIEIHGKLKDSGVEIALKIIWGESEGRNKFILKKKNDKDSWEQVASETTTTGIKKKVETLNGSEDHSEANDVKSFYKQIFDANRPAIKSFLIEDLKMDYAWKLSPRSAGSLTLEFSVPDKDEEKIKQIIKDVQSEKVDEKLINFIFSLAEKLNFDKSHFKITPSFKKKDGFSLVLKHT